MRARVLLGFVLLPALSGCTLSFGMAGALRDAERLEGPVPDSALRPHASVVLVTRDRKRHAGAWEGTRRVGPDSATVFLLDRGPNGLQQYPAAHVTRLYRARFRLNPAGLRRGLVVGAAVDLVLVGVVAYALRDCQTPFCRDTFAYGY